MIDLLIFRDHLRRFASVRSARLRRTRQPTAGVCCELRHGRTRRQFAVARCAEHAPADSIRRRAMNECSESVLTSGQAATPAPRHQSLRRVHREGRRLPELGRNLVRLIPPAAHPAGMNAFVGVRGRDPSLSAEARSAPGVSHPRVAPARLRKYRGPDKLAVAKRRSKSSIHPRTAKES